MPSRTLSVGSRVPRPSLRVQTLLTVLVVQAAVWGPLPAADAGAKDEFPLWEIGAGAGVLTVPYYRGSDENRNTFFPLVLPMIRSRFLRVDDQGVDSPLYSRPRLEFGLSGDGTLSGDSEEIDEREGMPDLDLVVGVGPALKVLLWHRPAARQSLLLGLPLRFAMAIDSGVDSVGQTFSPKVTYYRDIDWLGRTWRLGLSGGLEFGTDDYHEYYYQVEPEFATVDRPAYEADGGYGGTRLMATFHGRGKKSWASLFARYDRVDGATFEDSPLVASKDGWTVGALYTRFLFRSRRSVSVPPRGIPGPVEPVAPAAGDAEAPAERVREGRDFPVGEDKILHIAPKGHLYPLYLVDPRRPVTALVALNTSSSEVPDSGDSRLLIKIGGRYGLLRRHPEGEPDRGVQLDFDAGFTGMFDRENSTDNIGWDGLVGLSLAWRPGPRASYRTGLFHVSSHVGDEYAERTGRLRLEYTRLEWLLGASYEFDGGFRVYGEGGYALDIRNEEVMERPRAQAGLEYVSKRKLFKLLNWYAATDVSSFEENGWSPDVTLGAGVMLRADDHGRSYRIGVEYYDGRSLIGEFFLHDERYIAWGLWFDL